MKRKMIMLVLYIIITALFLYSCKSAISDISSSVTEPSITTASTVDTTTDTTKINIADEWHSITVYPKVIAGHNFDGIFEDVTPANNAYSISMKIPFDWRDTGDQEWVSETHRGLERLDTLYSVTADFDINEAVRILHDTFLGDIDPYPIDGLNKSDGVTDNGYSYIQYSIVRKEYNTIIYYEYIRLSDEFMLAFMIVLDTDQNGVETDAIGTVMNSISFMG